MAKQVDPTEKIGRSLMSGFLAELGKWAVIVTITICVLNAARDALGWGYDDTDDPSSFVHSGLRPYSDHLTGCEYLADREGSITPRLGRDGKQVCR